MTQLQGDGGLGGEGPLEGHQTSEEVEGLLTPWQVHLTHLNITPSILLRRHPSMHVTS